MASDEFVTAPTSRFGDLVLASVRVDEDPVKAILRTLSDPGTYAYVLDVRQAEEMVEDA